MTYEEEWDELVDFGKRVAVGVVIGAIVGHLLSRPSPAPRPVSRRRIYYVPTKPARPIGLFARIVAALKRLAAFVKRSLKRLFHMC